MVNSSWFNQKNKKKDDEPKKVNFDEWYARKQANLKFEIDQRKRGRYNQQNPSRKSTKYKNLLKSYYDVLDISESASPEEIRDKYRRLIKFYHPDSYQNNPEKLEIAEMKTKELTNAFTHLKDAGRV
jgi:DnaJ-domain-containing protein 1